MIQSGSPVQVCYDGKKMISLVSSNKLGSFVSSSVVIGLTVLVLILMFQVRTLYQDHLKLQRLNEYKLEFESVQAHFDSVDEDIDQTMQLSQVYQKVSADQD